MGWVLGDCSQVNLVKFRNWQIRLNCAGLRSGLSFAGSSYVNLIAVGHWQVGDG